MWRRVTRLLSAMATATAVALAGCGTIPVESFREYASAFEETRAAGYVMLDKISPIVAKHRQGVRSAEVSCEKDFTGTPRCFNPRLVGPSGRPPEPTLILVRRAALDLVAIYNTILLDLAEGRSEEEVQSRVAQVFDLTSEMVGLIGLPGAGAALPALLPALRGPLLSLAGRIERIRAAAVSRQAIVDGRDTVRAILVALAEETPKYYTLYRAQRLIDLVPFRTSQNHAGQQAIFDDINAYHTSLTSYTVLLHKTTKALETLAAAAERAAQPSPQNLRDVIKEAVELRLEAKKFWETVRKARDTSS